MNILDRSAEICTQITDRLAQIEDERARLLSAKSALEESTNGRTTRPESIIANTATTPRVLPPPVTTETLARALRTDISTMYSFLRKLGIKTNANRRYEWPSMVDPEVLRIVRAWEDRARRPAHLRHNARGR